MPDLKQAVISVSDQRGHGLPASYVHTAVCCARFHGIDRVIAGGESWPKACPMQPDWARSLRDQCTSAGVPFFKQWGEWELAPWCIDRQPGEPAEAYRMRAVTVGATHFYAMQAYEGGRQPVPAGHHPASPGQIPLPEGDAPVRRWGKRQRRLPARRPHVEPAPGRRH